MFFEAWRLRKRLQMIVFIAAIVSDKFSSKTDGFEAISRPFYFFKNIAEPTILWSQLLKPDGTGFCAKKSDSGYLRFSPALSQTETSIDGDVDSLHLCRHSTLALTVVFHFNCFYFILAYLVHVHRFGGLRHPSSLVNLVR